MIRLLSLGAALAMAVPVLASAPSAQFQRGQAAFVENCAACHGENGRGGSGYANPIWGQGAQLAKYRNAAALFEYHQLMMPFDDPTRITDELKWDLTLYVLVRHGTLAEGAELGAANAASVPIR